MNKDEWPRQSRKYGRLVTLGLNLAVGMAVFSAGGWWIDQKRDGGIFFTVVGMFLGLFYCGYEVWKTVVWLEEEEKINRKNRKENP